MSSIRYRGYRGPYSRGNNEFEGDMAAYLRANAPDNDEVLARMEMQVEGGKTDGGTMD